MAKTSSLRTHARGVKKGSPRRTGGSAKPGKARKAPSKAPRKAAGKTAGAGAARKGAARGGPRKGAKGAGTRSANARRQVAERGAMPQRAVSTAAARRAVARPRRVSPQAKVEAQAEHDHQDPRLSGVAGTGPEDSKVQTFNYGQFKNKAVARLDKPQNWFRRAAKPKS